MRKKFLFYTKISQRTKVNYLVSFLCLPKVKGKFSYYFSRGLLDLYVHIKSPIHTYTIEYLLCIGLMNNFYTNFSTKTVASPSFISLDNTYIRWIYSTGHRSDLYI